MVTPVFGADTESSVNERLPFSPLELESHWQVNCKATLTTLSRELDRVLASPHSHDNGDTVSRFAVIQKNLNKCAFIHNTPDTGRFTGCPDYRTLGKALASVRKHRTKRETGDAASHATMKKKINQLKRMLPSPDC